MFIPIHECHENGLTARLANSQENSPISNPSRNTPSNRGYVNNFLRRENQRNRPEALS